MNAIEIKSVSKSYKLYEHNKDLLKEFITRKERFKLFTALKDVSFSVEEGVTYGVIGQNGSGKSTLLRIVSNNTSATEGEVITKGRVSLLNVGAGISTHYTGIDNIYYKCTINGLTKDEIEDIIEDIIEFSELEEFIYQPVIKYSSGMMSKLGFAIAIHNPFDILIVDEALAVGDVTFRNKCMKKLEILKKSGKTILFVSHSSGQVASFCDKCCWLHEGELIAKGDSLKVSKLYNEFANKNLSIEAVKRIVEYDKRTYYEN